jgi:hypothetical protein
MLLGIGLAFALVGGLARRMVRVGPGEDEDESEKTPPATSKTEIDPQIAGYYSKPGDKQAAQ